MSAREPRHDPSRQSPLSRTCRDHRGARQTNSGFEELIHRYGHVVESLLGLGASTAPDDLAETGDLRKRRAALEKRCCWRSTAIIFERAHLTSFRYSRAKRGIQGRERLGCPGSPLSRG